MAAIGCICELKVYDTKTNTLTVNQHFVRTPPEYVSSDNPRTWAKDDVHARVMELAGARK